MHKQAELVYQILELGHRQARVWHNDERYAETFRKAQARVVLEAAQAEARATAEASLRAALASKKLTAAKLAAERRKVEESLDHPRLSTAFRRVEARIAGAREPGEVQALLDDASDIGDTYVLRGLADLGSASLRAKLAGGEYGLWQGYNVEAVSQRAKERLSELEAPELKAAREASAAAEVDARQLMADLRRVNERAALAGGGGPGPLAGLGDTTVQTPTAKGFRTERSNEFSELGEE